jgi:hypothetical protein
VKFVPGRTAILTIYEDGQEKEKIVMHTLKDRAAMHALFREKGFQLKSQEEVDKIMQERKAAVQVRNAASAPLLLSGKERERRSVGKESRKHSLRGRHATLEDLHNRRDAESRALKLRKEQELLALVSPRQSTMSSLALVAMAAVVGITIIGIAGKQRKRLRTAIFRR